MKILKKAGLFFLISVFVTGNAFVWAGASDTVGTYLESVRKDVEDASPEKTPISEAKQKYARAKQNLNALGEALANMKREFEQKIEQDPEFQPDAINLESPSQKTLVELIRQRNALFEQLKNLANQYQDLNSAMARNDRNFLNNVQKMTIKKIIEVGTPDPGDIDVRDQVEDAKDMKNFVDGYQKTKEKTEKTHEEFEKLKGDIVLLDQHIDEVEEIEQQFEGIKKGNPWIDGGFEELRRKVREARERDKAIKQKAEQHQQAVQGKVNSVTAPRPVPKDADPGYFRDALWKVYHGCEARYKALNEEMQKEIEKMNAVETMRPGPYGEYVVIVTPEDAMSYAMRQFETDKTIFEAEIQFKKALMPLVEEYAPRYTELYNNCCAEGGQLAGQLRMLAPEENVIHYYTALLKEMGAKSESMPLYVDRFQREISLVSKNLTVLQNGYNSRLGAAKQYASAYATEASNVLSAYDFYMKKDDEFIQETKALNEKYGVLRGLGNIQQKVKEMLDQGKLSEVTPYLLGFRRELQELYKKAVVLAQLKQLHRNVYLDVAERMPVSSPQAHGDMAQLARDMPQEGVADEAEKLSGAYAELSTRDINKERGAYFPPESIAVILEETGKFLAFLPRLSGYDQELRTLYGGDNYERAVEWQKEIMSELAGAGDIAGPWIKTTKAGPAPINFLFLSNETKEAIKQANTRLQGKQRQTALASYRLLDTRLNTRSVDNVSGVITVTNDDIMNGGLILTGRLSDMTGVNKILFSDNNGRTWDEIPISQNLSIAISPTAGMTYQPLLRIKTDFQETVDLPFFPNVTGIAFRTIDYQFLAQEVVTKIAEAYERQDTAAFAALIARDYLGNRVFLEEGVRFDFDMFANIQLKIFIDRIEKRGNQYVADTHWEKSQTPRKTGQQQMTTGKTVMIFVMEDGKLKIQNLRGNLIYATLSPEIAQASGLSQAIVEEIRIAEFERNPVQPGAGQTVNSGGLTGGTAPRTGTGAIIDVDGGGGGAQDGFDFSSGTATNGGAGGCVGGVGDICLEGNLIWPINGATIQTSATGYDSLATAPATGYGAGSVDAGNVGATYVFVTQEGYYGKMQITNFATAGVQTASDFKYAVQTDGSRYVQT